MKLLNGKELANKVKEELKVEVKNMAENGQSVCLAVIQVGNDAASSTYVRNKEKACEYIGIESRIYRLEETSEEDLIELIKELNKDNSVNGVLVQLPLPDDINEHRVIQAIAPEKDVDGFHELNVGKLMIGEDTFIPCTAKGIIELLKEYHIKIEGMNCVVVGRSNIAGKPVAMELLKHNATVTMCHSKTQGLSYICRQADILICAIGKPKYFDKEYISPNTVVIDVGIHRLQNGTNSQGENINRPQNGTLCGDVDFDDVKDIVSAITPVPNGVGAMTVAMLMKNCVEAAKMQYEDKKRKEVLEFIQRRFKKDCDWNDGNCYYFTTILKDRFPEGKIYYNVQLGHFVFQYYDRFYDWSGLVNYNENFISWDDFEEYDSSQKKRIIENCIL